MLQPRSADQVDMKLTNIKVGRVNDAVPSTYEEDIDMVHRWNKEYQRELTKPIRFLHTVSYNRTHCLMVITLLTLYYAI